MGFARNIRNQIRFIHPSVRGLRAGLILVRPAGVGGPFLSPAKP